MAPPQSGRGPNGQVAVQRIDERMGIPTFVGIGAQKSGTTTLHDILRQHPGVFLPKVKETKFFCDDAKFQKGLQFYEQTYFARAGENAVLGEIDPDYMYSEKSAERIRSLLGPGTKLIVMLRNPVDRALSHYLMTRRRGFETLGFEEALAREDERVARGEFERGHYSYGGRSQYANQIRRFLRCFSPRHFFFILFEEDFLERRVLTVSSLLEFIGAVPIVLDVDHKSNPASEPRLPLLRDLIYKPNPVRDFVRRVFGAPQWKMRLKAFLDGANQRRMQRPILGAEMRERIMQRYFADDICDLEKLLGRDLGVWWPRELKK